MPLGNLKLHKLHHQNRLSNDNTAQRDHADHGCCRKLCTHNPVSGNNAQHGDRNRRHNQTGQCKVFELPDDESVYKDQRRHECAAHIPERFVGHGPLTGPLNP